VAAGAVPDPDQGSDRLALFFVPTGDDPAAAGATVTEIRARLVRDVGLYPDFVVPVSREEFPKTGSGKIQRGQLVAELRAGTFDERLRELSPAEEAPEPTGGSPAWFFERVWRPAPAPAADPPAAGRWLLFGAGGDGERALRAGLPGEVVVVRAADRYHRSGDGYGIEPRRAADYERLLAEVGAVDAVVHAWSTAPMPLDRRADLDAALDRTAYSLSCLLTSLRAPTPVVVLATAGVWTGPDDPLEPAKGGLPSLVRTAAEEMNAGSVRYVDLPPDAPAQWPAIVATELRATPTGDDVVAYRRGSRLVPRLRPVPPYTEDRQAPLTAGGRYLITGGLGGIGFEIAQYLLAAYQARLLVVGRRDPGDDPAVAARCAELAELGSVRYAVVDVADEARLRDVVAESEADWGDPLCGVLHLAGAGIADQWADLDAHTLAHESVATFEGMYRAKVYGTWALTRLLDDRPDVPLVLFSSVNGEFGGSGFGAYASANGFLNAFAEHRARIQGAAACALAWSMWRGVGMNRTTSPALIAPRGFRPIEVDQGIASLLTALALDRPYLLIGLDRRNEHVLRRVDPEHLHLVDVAIAYTADGDVPEKELRRAVEAALAPGAGPVRLVRLDELADDDGTGTVDRDRLRLTIARTRRAAGRRTAPANALEQRLAEIWAQVLGRREVGRDETFFELGGGSLQAAQVIAKVNAGLSAGLAVEHLYEHPTVERLALALTERTG
jgi:NAD(P)-dependent dehydrogenase (short-subunit alcohol dehydrogenase family)